MFVLFVSLLKLLFCVLVGKILKMAHRNWLLALITFAYAERSCFGKLYSSRMDIIPSKKVKRGLSVQSGFWFVF